MKKKPEKDILGYEEENGLTEEKKKKETFNSLPPWYLILFVFLLALSARLVFLLRFTRIDEPMIGDVFHHWQIAYLSGVVGFKHGFLRLWDFKGMEYYWGLLHPLILVAAFTIFRSVSIVVPRIVSTLFGSGVVLLVFLIVSRHFNKKAAFASAVFLSLMPTAVFHDTLGLQEPLGLFFLLLGIYLFYRWAFFAGFSLMLAGMVRAEYWLFGAGLVLAILIKERNFDRKVLVLLGYSIPCTFYLKYMLDYTGNPIYPIYWNFLGAVAGEWSPSVKELAPRLVPARLICQILTGIFFISGLIVLWKKFKSYLFLLLGFANLAFVFLILGFGVYLYGFSAVPIHSGFIDKIWIGKLFAFPWAFLATLAVIFLLYFLPKRMGRLGTALGTLGFLVGLGATQLIWPSINQHYLLYKSPLKANRKAAEIVASKYTGGGTILLPPQSEFLTYFLVYNEGISGEKLVSSFYSPFYYYKGKDPFLEWVDFREEVIEWLKKQQAKLFVVDTYEENHPRMMELEEGKLFEAVGAIQPFIIYKVKIGEN